MENDRLSQILTIGQQLAKEGLVTAESASLLSEDLKDPSKLQALDQLLKDLTPKQLLRLHILCNYGIDNGDLIIDNKQPPLTYEELKKRQQTRKQSALNNQKAGTNKMAELIKISLEALQEKYQTSTNFLSLMICSHKEKIIQNYFGRLIQLLLGTSDYFYVRWDNTDSRPKIQYFNSTLNFLTIFLKDEPHFKQVMELFDKLGVGVTQIDHSNALFSSVFSIKDTGKYLCQVIDGDSESLIFGMRLTDEQLPQQLKADQKMSSLFELLLSQAAETLHVSKFEVLNTQYILKSILNLLEFCIKLDARLLQLTLESHYRPKFNFSSFEQLIELLEKSGDDAQTVKKTYQQYCNKIFWFESTINKYKVQAMDSFNVYLNFNASGELRFVSNKLPASLYRRLSKKNPSEEEEVTVFDFFSGRQGLMANLQLVSQSKPIEETYKFVQDGRRIEAVFSTDEEQLLQSFYCVIDLKSQKVRMQQSDTSFKNLSTNSINSSDSEKQITTRIRDGTGINREAQKMLIQQEQQRPGVSKTGWLEAFMKNDVLDKFTRKAGNNSKKELTSSEQTKERPRQRMSIYLVQQPSTDVGKTLANVNKFDFNLLEVDRQHLTPVARHILTNLKFSIEAAFDINLLDNFLRELATKYGKHNNPFHNFSHGVNVMHMCYLLSRLEKSKQYLTDLNIFALVFSGLCHDVGHPGRTNMFEINSMSKKALRYNDRSVISYDIQPLENYHASTSYDILLRPQNNFLASLKKEQFTQIRKEFISNILATDIKEHFPLLTNFEAKLKSQKGFEKIPADIELTTTFLIHTSDFAGACKPFDISRKWAELVNLEFTSQYNEEGELGIAQTPYMKNLDQEDVLAQNEAGFIKVIVRPLFKALSDLHDKQQQTRRLLKNFDENMLIWEKIVADHKARQQTEQKHL